MEGGNDINGDHKHSFRLISRPQSCITCFYAVRSTLWRCAIFKICVTLYQSWTPLKTQSQSLTSDTFCDNRFLGHAAFFSTLRIYQKMKSPLHLLSLPSPDDACCQGDRYNPGDRPFLWAVPCDWPIDRRGEGGSADWAFWLAGWLAEAGALADRDSVGSIDLIGWQAGRQ